MSERKRVVAGFIEREDKVLLVKRPKNKKRGGLWEFPGGKVENGETLEQALERELKEELGLEANPVEILEKIVYSYPEEEIELILIKTYIQGEPHLSEAQELIWIPLDRIDELELCPADKQLIDKLKSCKKIKMG